MSDDYNATIEEKAREWLRERMPKLALNNQYEIAGEFFAWFSEELGKKILIDDEEYIQMKDIFRTEKAYDEERRKQDGSWFADYEETYETIHPYTWDEINSLKFSENRWRIEGLLPMEGFVILAGVSGEGKSFVSLEMANALTTPRNFLDDSRFSVIGTNVLYIDAEMSKSELQRRGKKLGFDAKREHGIYFVSREDVDLRNEEESFPDHLEIILDIIEKKNIGVVFVDTLRAVAGGMEENKAEEVRRFFNRFKKLKDKNVCVVFLDHLRKGGDGRSQEPQKEHLFASQDKTASCEILLMLRKPPGESTIAVYQRKNRLGDEMKPFDIWIHDTVPGDEEKNRIVLEYGGEHNGYEKKLDEAKKLIVELLEVKSHTRKELIEAVGDETGASERTIQSALKSLHNSQQVDVKTMQRQHHYSIPTPKTPETGVLIKE